MSSDAKGENDGKGQSFSLTSTSSLFTSRSHDIFGGLEALEQKHAAHQKVQESSELLERAGIIKEDPMIEDGGNNQSRELNRSISRYRGSFPNYQRSNRHRTPRSLNNDRHDRNNDMHDRNNPRENFRRPGKLPPRSRLPDFKKHPEKWTSYSLEDVSEKDLSEKSNTRAALDFLWERKNVREQQERLAAGLPAEEEKFESESAACSKGIISFSKKQTKTKEKKLEGGDNSGSHNVSLDTNTIEKTFSEQDGDDLSSPFSTDAGSIDLGFRSRKTKLSASCGKGSDFNFTSSGPDVDADDKQGCDDPAPTFKARKNVRKQFRRKKYDDEDDDNDG